MHLLIKTTYFIVCHLKIFRVKEANKFFSLELIHLGHLKEGRIFSQNCICIFHKETKLYVIKLSQIKSEKNTTLKTIQLNLCIL